jgi:hypothetical protein
MATNHHDTGYKELFSHPEFVQQLVEGFAPSEIAGLMILIRSRITAAITSPRCSRRSSKTSCGR